MPPGNKSLPLLICNLIYWCAKIRHKIFNGQLNLKITRARTSAGTMMTIFGACIHTRLLAFEGLRFQNIYGINILCSKHAKVQSPGFQIWVAGYCVEFVDGRSVHIWIACAHWRLFILVLGTGKTLGSVWSRNLYATLNIMWLIIHWWSDSIFLFLHCWIMIYILVVLTQFIAQL